MNKVNKTDADWQAELTPDEYHVLREKGTERAFSGEYNEHKDPGTYLCRACGNALFDANTKFDSGTGWPSFFAPLSKESVLNERDVSHGMVRTEVMCNQCGSHLGHLFDDGPQPTGKRYCMNSLSLKHQPKSD
ncbi:peptide-methionine (R)-S-oxide reductase MsrB [bacterium]|nr:peptide-methionine (R)-S-oxide reductase MsrB [bacterium]